MTFLSVGVLHAHKVAARMHDANVDGGVPADGIGAAGWSKPGVRHVRSRCNISPTKGRTNHPEVLPRQTLKGRSQKQKALSAMVLLRHKPMSNGCFDASTEVLAANHVRTPSTHWFEALP